MAKMMKKAQNGADMVSKIKSAASKPSGDRKMGMNFDKKSFDSVKSFDSLPSILGKPLPKMKKKAKNGTSFGMLSVKAGVDSNPKATFADKIAGAKKMAKSGKKVKKAQYGVDMTPGAMKMGGKAAKQAAIAIAMKKAGKAPKKASYGKMMKSGGKCKNGC